jgi:hypothetical protein
VPYHHYPDEKALGPATIEEDFRAALTVFVDEWLATLERALIAMVLKAVRDADAEQAADVQAMRDLGRYDMDILDALDHGARQVAGDIIFNAFKIERDY